MVRDHPFHPVRASRCTTPVSVSPLPDSLSPCACHNFCHQATELQIRAPSSSAAFRAVFPLLLLRQLDFGELELAVLRAGRDCQAYSWELMPLLRAACVRDTALTAVQQHGLRSSALAPCTIRVRG